MGRRKKGRNLHGILLLDKPSGGSSNQVLQRIRRLYDANKAGHTGTLDPLATGMLPLCFGEATKLSSFLIDAEKGYEATMLLGVVTDTADTDGTVIQTKPVPESLTEAALLAICNEFMGESMQMPPMVSAIKVDGQRLYKLAREGKTVEREPRKVNISQLDVLAYSGNTVRIAVKCSKGTYIRSLVTDIGDKIGCGACVSQLRRTFVAPFNDLPMWTEEQLQLHPDRDSLLLPIDAGLGHLPKLFMDEQNVNAFAHGQWVSGVVEQGTVDNSLTQQGFNTPEGTELPCYRVYANQGTFLGLAEPTATEQFAPKRVLQLN